MDPEHHIYQLCQKFAIDKSRKLALTLFCVGGMNRTVSEWLVSLVFYLPGEG